MTSGPEAAALVSETMLLVFLGQSKLLVCLCVWQAGSFVREHWVIVTNSLTLVTIATHVLLQTKIDLLLLLSVWLWCIFWSVLST